MQSTVANHTVGVNSVSRITKETTMGVQGSLTRPDLVREMAYLERLLYKNKQQHRSSRHFQQLLDVRIRIL